MKLMMKTLLLMKAGDDSFGDDEGGGDPFADKKDLGGGKSR